VTRGRIGERAGRDPRGDESRPCCSVIKEGAVWGISERSATSAATEAPATPRGRGCRPSRIWIADQQMVINDHGRKGGYIKSGCGFATYRSSSAAGGAVDGHGHEGPGLHRAPVRLRLRTIPAVFSNSGEGSTARGLTEATGRALGGNRERGPRARQNSWGRCAEGERIYAGSSPQRTSTEDEVPRVFATKSQGTVQKKKTEFPFGVQHAVKGGRPHHSEINIRADRRTCSPFCAPSIRPRTEVESWAFFFRGAPGLTVRFAEFRRRFEGVKRTGVRGDGQYRRQGWRET